MWTLILRTPDAGDVELRPDSPTKFWADPFLIPGTDGRGMMAEEFDYRTNLGQIVELALDDSYKVLSVTPSFPSNRHQSYPFTIDYDGTLYLIAEMSDRGLVPLFKRTTSGWEEQEPLLADFAGLDSTLVVDETGALWLCTSPLSDPDRLEVFGATELGGPWTHHATLAQGTRGSRSAGRPWRDESGQWIRPAQDGSERYGGGVVLKAVAADWKSESAHSQLPVPTGFEGLHTIDCLDGFEIVDAVSRRSITTRHEFVRWRAQDLRRRASSRLSR